MKGRIFSIKKYAIHDGPSIRTTVFFKGCPLSCAWCHNPEGILFEIERVWNAGLCAGCGQCLEQCPAKALVLEKNAIARNKALCTGCGHCTDTCPALAHETLGQDMDVAQVMEEIKKDIPFYDQSGGGVTFSGGEPLAQPEFLVELLCACKALDLHCAIDTTLYTQTRLLEQIAASADLFLVDIKHMDSVTHKKFTGVTNQIILSNIKHLAQRNCAMRFRIPLVKGANTSVENIQATADFLSRTAPGSRVDLLPFHDMASSKYKKLGMAITDFNLTQPDNDTIQRCVDQLERAGLNTTIGG